MVKHLARALVVLFTVTMVTLSSGLLAVADAADPILASTHLVGATLHGDGSVTVTIGGGWQWTTHNSDCNLDKRSVGYAVDWNDPTQAGNLVAGTTDVGVAATNVRNPADNEVHPTPADTVGSSFNDPLNPASFASWRGGCGTYSAVNDYNSGTWGPISHTYASIADVTTVCALMYDVHLHDDHGAPNNAQQVTAGGANHNTDNSLQDNAGTPLGNGCFSTGNIHVHKQGTQAQALAGAVFTLYNDGAPQGGTFNSPPGSDTSTGQTCTTDALGDCAFIIIPVGQYWVVETTPPAGFSGAAPQHVTLSQGSPIATLTFVDSPTTADARITLTPGSATNEVGSPHTLTATVQTDSGSGFTNASGATVSFTVTGSATPSSGSCVTGGAGTCTFVITSTSAGSNTIHATTTVTVNSQTLTRATGDGLSGDSADATKTYVDANLVLSPLSATNHVGDAHTV
ncbi:MAG TPA: SpaA isopeptide-forming pilin-related protein, partial [Jatrophihabitantaceae bacterium]|nr:SpaA isopeptide-forming pilin-related protein [Jatrophihabitantaceae bacterium]